MNILAPILVFVYNRPEHTKQTIEALLNCHLASESELYVFSDGAKPDKGGDIEKVTKVRQLIHNVKGFKNIKIIESKHNKGLADSIIDGTNHAFKNHENVITLEDDVVVGHHFLEFMNRSLSLYKSNNNIIMISGYLFNLPFGNRRKSNFFLATGTTQAWATWKHKWEAIDFNPTDYVKLKSNKWLKFRFNMYGSIDYSKMLIEQMETKTISSWAIRLRWHFFNKNGVTLFPAQNLIENTGWDGSGNHCSTDNTYNDNSKEMHSKCDTYPKRPKAKLIDSFLLIFFFYKIRVTGFINYHFKKTA